MIYGKNLDSQYSGTNIFDIEDIDYSIKWLKNGRACGVDGLSKENIVYSHPALLVYLKLLFRQHDLSRIS